MIEQVMKSNILHEVSNLLKKQNKENNNDSPNISFDDLFLIKDNENFKSNNEVNNVIITFEDSQDYLEEQNKNTQNHNENIENDNYQNNHVNKQDKMNDVTVQKDSREIKNVNKDQTDKDLKNPVLKEDNIKTDKNNYKKDTLEAINIQLKYRNIELKGDLDYRSKQKIKSIIHDLKAGRINTNVANSFITQVIRNSHIEGLKSLNKNKKIKVEIKKDEKESKLKDLVLNKKDTNLNIEKDKNILQNNKEKNFNQFTASDNKTGIKAGNKFRTENKEHIKNDDVKLKDLKSEIKLEVNNKNPDIATINKDIFLNTSPKKTLEINKQALLQQVVKNTKVILAQNQTKFSTMIRPDNFGRIDFQFTVKDGKMNGRLILHNQDNLIFLNQM